VADVPVHRERFPLADYWALAKKPAMLRLLGAEVALTLGPGWMSALYLFFFRDALGYSTGQASGLLAVYIAAGVIGAPVTALVSRKLGKHRT